MSVSLVSVLPEFRLDAGAQAQSPPNSSLLPQLQAHVNAKTKPLGSLGRVEELGIQLGLIQGVCCPVLTHPAVVVFAADHGIAAVEPVSAYPQSVTAQMVLNFLAGGAAMNVFANTYGLETWVVDVGVAQELPVGAPRFLSRKAGQGTAPLNQTAAMTPGQLRQALEAGVEAVEILHDRGTNVWVAGEMGIGNTTASAAILCKLAGLPIEVAVGKGTGVDEVGLARKRTVVEQALRLHAEAVEPLEVLRCLGGFELAALVGSYLRAADRQMLLLVDGFIASVAWLVAYRLNPGLKHYTVFSHQSAESGHKALLQSVGMRPLLNLDLRLGEATGALLAWPLIQAAVAFMSEMATFEQAAVDTQLLA